MKSCPFCGSKNIAEYLYGLPCFNEALEKDLEAKRIILGGCMIDGSEPSYHCNDCERDFGYRDDASSSYFEHCGDSLDSGYNDKNEDLDDETSLVHEIDEKEFAVWVKQAMKARAKDGECKNLSRDMECFGFKQNFSALYSPDKIFASIVVVNGEAKYAIIDDELYGEIWCKLQYGRIPLFKKQMLAHYRSKNYNHFVVQRFKVFENEGIDSLFGLSGKYNNNVSVNIDIVNAKTLAVPEIGSDVVCSVTCIPRKINFYQGSESLTETIIPLNMPQYYNRSLTKIIGKVRGSFIKTNAFTKIKYVVFELESLGIVFDVPVPLSEVSIPVDEVAYIAGEFKLNGYIPNDNYERLGYARNIQCGELFDEEFFEENIKIHLRQMRTMKDEFLIVDFGDAETVPVFFVQAAIVGDESTELVDAHKPKNYHIEYAMKNGERKLVAIAMPNDFCGYESAVKVFHSLCVEGKEPAGVPVRDISYLID